MDNEKKGFLSRAKDWLNAADLAPDVIREGSIGSAGGDSPLPGILPPARSAVMPMSVEAALSMSAVYRAVDILCTSVQQLELRVERGGSLLKTTPALVAKPDLNSNASKFLKKTTMSLATHGNAYWKVTRADELAPVTNLEVLDPNLVIIDYDKAGNRIYRYVAGNREVIYKAWQVKHLKLMEPFGSEYGLGPIQAARVELQNSIDTRGYAAAVFTEVPTGVLSAKTDLDPVMAKAYQQGFKKALADGERTFVAGNGITYEPIMLNPVDAQFIENQQFNKTQVATLFGVPANYLLADAGNSLTYQNMIMVDTAFVKYTLTSYLREIEEAFSDLLPRGQVARFRVEGFLRADDSTRATVNKTYKDMGVLSAEEIRIAEGWGPLPEGLKNQPAPVAPVANEGDDTNE